MDDGIRSTQRAPLSCVSCYKRKVKCDKKIPCGQCIRRGAVSTCRREQVKVKGQLIQAKSDGNSTGWTYQDLVLENLALKAQVQATTTGVEKHVPSDGDEVFVLDEMADDPSAHLFDYMIQKQPPRTVSNYEDIEFPTREQSAYLILQARERIAWIHYALHHPTFEEEHDEFWKRTTTRDARLTYDPAWLAIYFSTLSAVLVFLHDEDTPSSPASRYPLSSRMRKWYDAAVFFLEKSDYLRVPTLMTVQTIAILGIVFNNVGEFNFHSNLWSIAVRTAQTIRIDNEKHLASRPPIEREVCRRLWWTLVICDWLPPPRRAATLLDQDFNVNLPAIKDDDELAGAKLRPASYPRKIHYHIIMIHISTVYYRYRLALRLGRWTNSTIVDLVTKTDERLAQIIAELPPWLQNEDGRPKFRDVDCAWASWQRTKLSLLLHNLRITVNKSLQNLWLDQGLVFQRVRSICLDSSNAIISLALDGGEPVERLNTWAVVMELFSAAVTIAIEEELQGGRVDDDPSSPVRRCMAFFESVQEHNQLAVAAVQMLRAITSKSG
ncbi:hypothetical protein PV08_09333 [Exophiala spinifera]|uniref:Zn(2)-C6 fungal-type domain-containing protein n=1 Tax=Exophiala spinifera TaxID=91928 RepID=A0A0D2BLL5_9EURO|nr:uncharacterized protein PV08_09333 [Exophiala spinifera]KIW12059.1 hypothetical protein PV08_09333 [Exophiala spinifera]